MTNAIHIRHSLALTPKNDKKIRYTLARAPLSVSPWLMANDDPTSTAIEKRQHSLAAGAYTGPLFSWTREVSDTKYTLNTP
jgi:hypothetical protein